MAAEPVWSELVSGPEFPVSRENTGNFLDFGGFGRIQGPITSAFSASYTGIPCSPITGNFSAGTGNYRDGTRSMGRIQSTWSRPLQIRLPGLAERAETQSSEATNSSSGFNPLAPTPALPGPSDRKARSDKILRVCILLSPPIVRLCRIPLEEPLCEEILEPPLRGRLF